MRASALVLSPLVIVVAGACSSESAPPSQSGPPADECTFKGEAEAPLADPKPHTPRWAFRPWISKDISDGPDTYAFVKGFEDRDTPVGVVVLDSPWETHYNTFVPNPKRYPEFPKMVDDLHAKQIKLVLWVTQMVNRLSLDVEEGGDIYQGESPNYEEGSVCGFFVNDGDTYGWWKGIGAGVDFFNPRARAWWHAQQKPLLDMGIDGWKLDFGESYIETPVVKTAAGDKPHQAYSEEYYRDFYAYGVSVRGPEFVTMVRPYDKSYHFEGRFFARREHAPVAWVGDNRRDWLGLSDALDHILRSAAAGYPVVGSDIGGYLDRDDKSLDKTIPPDTLAFARWTAMAAWTPFFQLHGRANYTPWTVPDHVDETVAMYRYWAKLHDAMVPFFYSLSEHHWANGGSMLKPLGQEPWANDYRFVVGDAFLVAPILDATGKRSVPLPNDGRYFDWWNPAADAIAGGTTIDADVSADRKQIPVYVREGAIVPLAVVDDANALGTKASIGAATVLLWPSEAGSTFVVHDEDGRTTTVDAKRASAATTVSLSRAVATSLVRVRFDGTATSVTVNGAATPLAATREALDGATSGAWIEAATRSVWVKTPKSDVKLSIEIR